MWSLEFIAIPPVSAILVAAVISLAFATIRQRPFKNKLWKPHHWLAFSQLLFFPAAVSVGVIWYAKPDPMSSAQSPGVTILTVLDYGSVVTAAFWIWRMKGFRWYGASLMVIQQMIIEGAFFVAGMATSGRWL